MQKSTIILFCLGLLTAVSGFAQQVEQTFYIDFGENNVSSRGNKTEGADANGHYWTNVYSSPSERLYPNDWTLINSENAKTAYTLQVGTYFHTNGMSGGGGLISPSADLLGDLAVATATQDYMHVETTQDYNIIRFRGLDLNKAYRFSCFGHRQATDVRGGVFEFHGENSWSEYHQMSGSGIGANGYNGNNNKILVSDPIFPDKNGDIAVFFNKTYKNGMMYLNCMKMEELTGLERPNQMLTMTQQMYIDFGETANDSRGHKTEGADKNGNYWNNVTSGNSGSNQIPTGTTLSLINSSNVKTGYTLKTLSLLETNGCSSGGGLTNPSETLLGDLAITTATEDYVWIYDNSTRSVSISGLDKTKCYRFYIFGSRNTSESDRRISWYQVAGQNEWETNLTTSGQHVGGQNVHGNNRNVAISDYIYPDASGTITFSCKKYTDITTSHAHFNLIKIEEYAGGTRPADPVAVEGLKVSGDACESSSVEMHCLNKSKGLYETYLKLTPGNFHIDVITTQGGIEDAYVMEGSEKTITEEQVVRVKVDTKSNKVTITPVELYLKGNIVSDGTKVQYAGNGVWSSEVDMNYGNVFLFSDKYFYFAFNNSDALSVKRLSGSRTDVAMPSEGFSCDNIRINRGTYTMTLDMRNYTWDVNAPIDPLKISAFGSSVCNGQGASSNQGYAYLYGQQLAKRFKNGDSAYDFTVSGVSIGGNTTTLLKERYDEMTHDFGRYVIYGLSMGNEGIHEATDKYSKMNSYLTNLKAMVDQTVSEGKLPVVMNNYTRGDFTEDDYKYIKQANLKIHEWDVPSVNTLGAIDNGAGHWADGYMQDNAHPTTAGHQQFMAAIPPTLFDAMAMGKPLPVRDRNQEMVLGNGSTLTILPEAQSNIYPFTVTLRVKGNKAGRLITVNPRSGSRSIFVDVTEGGNLACTAKRTSTTADVMEENASVNIADETKWYDVTLTYYHAQKRLLLYVNNKVFGELSYNLNPGSIIIGDAETPVARDISEVSFWRSAMTKEEITAVHQGKMMKSSLEIYTPVKEEMKTSSFNNLATSLNTLSYTAGTLTAKVVGDANGDGKVTVSDLTAMANYILGGTPDGFDAEAADANGDGNVTVADLTVVASIVLTSSN